MDGPDIRKAIEGRTNNPELIIAPLDMLNTSSTFSSFFSSGDFFGSTSFIWCLLLYFSNIVL